MGLSNPSRETKFSGANADREILMFPGQLTTCRIGNLTRLIHTLAICVTIEGDELRCQKPFWSLTNSAAVDWSFYRRVCILYSALAREEFHAENTAREEMRCYSSTIDLCTVRS